MAFDALETEFANAKLVRSLSRRDDRRYYWRLLPPDSDQCTRIAASYNVSTHHSLSAHRFSSSRTAPPLRELLYEPCAVHQLESFLRHRNQDDALRWLQCLRYVKPGVQSRPHQSHAAPAYMHPTEIFEDLVRKDPRDSVAIDVSSGQQHNLGRSRSNIVAVAKHILSVPPNVSEAIEAGLARGSGMEVFLPLVEIVLSWMESEIFPTFIASDEFRRFTQLKEFAMRPVTADDFSTFRIMGRGAYGAVSAVEKVNTHRIYAWKEMNKRQLKHQRAIDVALNELKVLVEIDSPFVAGLRYCIQTNESLVLVLDFCSGGDLSYHMKRDPPINDYRVPNDPFLQKPAPNGRRRKNPMPPELAQFYVAEIVLGLEHMHSKRIVFRDLKPANVLLDRHGHILISDLGLAKKFTDKKPTTSSLGGTPGYWAPEVLARQPYSVWVDWWSLGVFLYEALCGRRPACRCMRGSLEWCPFVDSKEQEDNAKKGGTLKLCLEFPDPFFSAESRDLIEKLLRPRPQERLGYNGSADVKAHPYFKNIDWSEAMSRRLRPAFVPGDTVHAVSLQEVGEINKQRYKKVMLDHRDQKLFSQFKFMEDRVVQEEIVQVLEEEAEKQVSQWTPFEMQGRLNPINDLRCCTIL